MAKFDAASGAVVGIKTDKGRKPWTVLSPLRLRKQQNPYLIGLTRLRWIDSYLRMIDWSVTQPKLMQKIGWRRA